jgi:hypothetical protein
MPVHAGNGMKILGPFCRSNELENVLMPMIGKYDVIMVDDPASSVRF